MNEDHPTWKRLQSQIAWYDEHASSAQRSYKILKVLEILVAASIPAVAAAGVDVAVAGALGAVVVVLAGLQALFSFQTDWLSYRGTCEALRREEHLYLVKAGVYATEDRDARLALTVENLVSDETTQWAAAQQEIAANASRQRAPSGAAPV